MAPAPGRARLQAPPRVAVGVQGAARSLSGRGGGTRRLEGRPVPSSPCAGSVPTVWGRSLGEGGGGQTWGPPAQGCDPTARPPGCAGQAELLPGRGVRGGQNTLSTRHLDTPARKQRETSRQTETTEGTGPTPGVGGDSGLEECAERDPTSMVSDPVTPRGVIDFKEPIKDGDSHRCRTCHREVRK